MGPQQINADHTRDLKENGYLNTKFLSNCDLNFKTWFLLSTYKIIYIILTTIQLEEYLWKSYFKYLVLAQLQPHCPNNFQDMELFSHLGPLYLFIPLPGKSSSPTFHLQHFSWPIIIYPLDLRLHVIPSERDLPCSFFTKQPPLSCHCTCCSVTSQSSSWYFLTNCHFP